MVKKASGEKVLTERQSIALFKHCNLVEKRIIKALKLKNFEFRVGYEKKFSLTKEQLQLVRPICIDEKEYREKNKLPNPLWAFNIIQDFFILQ